MIDKIQSLFHSFVEIWLIYVFFLFYSEDILYPTLIHKNMITVINMNSFISDYVSWSNN